MTTTSTPLQTTTRPATVAELQAQYREALANCNEAWGAQSRTTVDEGYTYEQAAAAICQAKAAEQVKRDAYTRWQVALATEIEQPAPTRRSRQPGFTGAQWPTISITPNAYVCRKADKVEQAIAFFA